MSHRVKLIRSEEGLTLIEIIATFLIISVLLLIAVPVLGEQEEKGQDSDAKTELSTIERVGKSVWTENDQLLASEAELVSSIQGSADGINITAGTSFTPGVINIHRDGSDSWTLRGVSESGEWFAIRAVYDGPGQGVYRTMGTSAIPVINSVSNPSFETTTSPWTTNPLHPGSTLSLQSGQAYSGENSMLITTDGGDNYEGARLPDSQTPVTPSTDYVLSARVKAPTDYAGRQLRMTYNTTATPGGAILPGGGGGRTITLSDEWQEIEIPLTTIAGANYLRIEFYPATSDNSAISFNVDSVSLTAGDTAWPYFDGDYPGGTWSGTPEESASSALPWESW